MQTLGPYQLLEELGRGGMGVVFHGFDPAIGRPVAIKIIQASQFASALEDAEFKLRFAREAAAAGRLSHPSIVTIYQFGEENGVRYLVQELVNGRSLEQMLSNNQPLDRNTAVPILSQVADALDYAHGEGVVHRDIKPANILVRPDGKVKITDFGIAHIATETVTRTGLTLGTPAYMSPEQIMSARVNGQTDQFSLAVTAYQMLSGRRPFAADSGPALMHQIMSEEPQPLHTVNPAVSARTSEVISRALAKKPEDRFARCTEFAVRLAESLNTGVGRDQHSVATETMQVPVAAPERKRRISPVLLWAAAGLAVVGLAVAAWVRGRGPIAQPRTALPQKSDTDTPRPSQTEPIEQPRKMADTGPRGGTPSAQKGKSDVVSKLTSGKTPAESASKTESPSMGEKLGTSSAPSSKAGTPVSISSDLTGTSTPGGYAVGQESPGKSWVIGAAFTPVGSNYALDQFRGLLSARSEQSLMIIELHRDAGGVPGLLLESWQIHLGSAPELVTLNSILHPTLIAGQQYWLTAGMADPASRGTWWINHIGGLCCGAPGEVQGISTSSLNGAPFKPGTLTTSGFHAFEVTGRIVGGPDTKSLSVEKKAAAPTAPAVGSSPTADARAAEVKHAQGLQLEQQRDLSEAISAFTEAIRLKPDFADAYYHRCSCYGMLNIPAMNARGVEDCTKAIEIQRDLEGAYEYRGLLYLGQRNYDRAIEDSSEAIRLQPNDASAYHVRAGAYAGQNRPDLAIRDYTVSLRIRPSWNNYYYRAEQYVRQKQADLAIQDCAEAIRLNPDYGLAYKVRGDAYQLKHEYDRAIQDYNEAIRLAPKYGSAYTARGAAKELLGDKTGAAADRQRAQELGK